MLAQGTVAAAGLPRLRDELQDYVLCTVLPPGASGPMYAELARVTDRAAYDAIEAAVNALLAEVTMNAFLLGWDCGRDPARLVFKP